MMALDMMPTAFLFLAAAPLLLALPVGMLRAVLLLLVPLVAGWHIWTLPEGTFAQVQFLGMTLDMMRVDKLSRVFGLIFCLAAFWAIFMRGMSVIPSSNWLPCSMQVLQLGRCSLGIW